MARLTWSGLLSSVLLAAVLFAPHAWARGKRPRIIPVPDVEAKEVPAATNFTPVKTLTHLVYKDNATAQGWLQVAFKPEKDKKYELLVSLHGAGADPKGFLYSDVASRRKCYVLVVAGSTPANGNGFQWSDSNKDYVAGLTVYVCKNYPVDKKKVILMGHSAGGRMTFVTHNYAGYLYSGLLTTAAAGTPGSGQYGVRVVMFFGDQDPNYSAAPSVRTNFNHKKRKAPGSLRIVTGLGHEIADPFYVDHAVDWLLTPNARGGEVTLPKVPPVKAMETYSHILVRYKGSESATERALRTSKRRAQSEVKLIKKYMDHKKQLAHILMEAAQFSHDDKTAPCGGLISAEGLETFDPALKEAALKLRPGESSAVLESPQGYHLIYRHSSP